MIKTIHVSFAREFFKDIATKHFSGQVGKGVTEQATFPMSPNERLLFGMWPKVGRSRTLYLDVDHVKKDNWLMSSVIHWDECWKPQTKKGIWNPIILINRHRFLCQQNRNHSMSSLPKFVLSALKISFQSRFSRFDNISHVMISFSNPGWRHFTMTRMRTYLIFGDRPNLLISCCIPAIPRFISKKNVKDTYCKWGRDWATGRFGLQVVEYKECQK